MKENIRFVLMACLVGLFSVIFAEGCELSFAAFLKLFHAVNYGILVIIPLAFVIIKYLMIRFCPEAAGSGIPQALAVCHIPNAATLNVFKRNFAPRIILTKSIFVLLGTAVGATIGREGPTTQIGAAIMLLGAKHLNYARTKFLLTVGAAAGLASAFNTPIGGVVFLFEELSKNSDKRWNYAKAAGVFITGAVTIVFLGDYTYFGKISAQYLNYQWEIFFLSIAVGVIAAVNCWLFVKIIQYLILSPVSRFNQWRKAHPYLSSVLFGFLAAGLGVLSHGSSFGNGYVESRDFLTQHIPLPTFYYFDKMFGSIFSTSSGIPGGYFSTSLSIGSGLGNLLYHIFSVTNVEQYCLLGMGAFLAALTRAPITSTVMVLQVTSSQTFTLPLAIAALTAAWVAHLLGKGLYEQQVEELVEQTQKEVVG